MAAAMQFVPLRMLPVVVFVLLLHNVATSVAQGSDKPIQPNVTLHYLRPPASGADIIASTPYTISSSKPIVSDWPSWGRDIYNRRWAADEKIISTKNVGSLQILWKMNVTGDTSATQAVVNGIVYFPAGRVSCGL